MKQVNTLKNKFGIRRNGAKNIRDVPGNTGGLKCIDYSHLLNEFGQDKENEINENIQSGDIELKKGKKLLERFKKISEKYN